MSSCVGPDAFRDVRLCNQDFWDKHPERADKEALDALHTGGFDGDCISRRVGNYEGQIIAISKGWVDPLSVSPAQWRINDAGRAALRAAGKSAPTFLPVRDDWHGKDFEYCAYETDRHDKPALELFKEVFPSGASWGMKPILMREHAIALRDYLNEWIERTTE